MINKKSLIILNFQLFKIFFSVVLLEAVTGYENLWSLPQDALFEYVQNVHKFYVNVKNISINCQEMDPFFMNAQYSVLL